MINFLALENLLKILGEPEAVTILFLTQTKAEDILGNDFYSGVLEIKDDIQLDRTLFGYFNRCSLANQVLAKYNFS